MKRKGVTLLLLWQEYRASHPDGYGYTWFCDQFAAFERANPTYRNRHEAGAVMQTDYAGHTIPIIDPRPASSTRPRSSWPCLRLVELHLRAASFSQKLPDWIEGRFVRWSFFGGVPKAIVCDNLKAGVAKALSVRAHPDRDLRRDGRALRHDNPADQSRKPRDKGKVEGAVLIVERWILARLRNRRFFDLAELNAEIAGCSN